MVISKNDPNRKVVIAMYLLRDYRSRLAIISLAVCLMLLVLSVDGQQTAAATHVRTKASKKEVVKALASHNRKRANWAIAEVMQRGPSMIPLLLKNKGDRRPFRGGGLGNRDAAQSIDAPTGNAKHDEGRVITVEVASLYLISSLYHQTLEFAQSPYLTDHSLPAIERRAFNSRHLVAQAWAATEKWATLLKSEGMESLRNKTHDPLQDSHVGFW